MSRKFRNFGFATVLFVLIAASLALVPAALNAFDSTRSPQTSPLIVHEWGTFTSFAGSDGVNLDFRPLVTNDLPSFIMRPGLQPGELAARLSKSRFFALQRMETPVTYFYTRQPRTVNVRVDFPQGMLSEWYPVARAYASGANDDRKSVKGSAYLDWGTVRLTPPQEFANVRVRGDKNNPQPPSFPSVGNYVHYGYARETDSAIVETVDANRGSHFEKFLFYRGLGDFELPVKLAALGNDRFEVTNTADHDTGALFLVHIDGNHVRFTQASPVRQGAVAEITLPSTESTVDHLAAATIRELIAEGLYDKEARAMVNTWRSSWFGESGTRLLYLLPNQIVDEFLPLKVEPAPDETVRVFVGRLDTITPEDGQRLTQKLTANPVSNKPLSGELLAELKPLGRFAEPALEFLIGQTKDPETRHRLNAVMTQVRSTQ
jgi:hypothetical protein